MAKRIFLTGMSGTGKSSVIAALAAEGYKTVDMDASDWSEYRSDGSQMWREERLQNLLSALEEDDVLFLSGCADNQGKFYPQFDKIVLLSAPAKLIVERLKTRTTNTYGKHPDELAEVMGYIDSVEPLLRKGADLEIDTSIALEEVVSLVLALLDQA